MNKPAIPATITATFLLRFWRETAGGEVRWRGRIEHIQSGESVAFLDLEVILSFLRRYGIAAPDQNPNTETILP
jgi:hypothetical protein